MTSKKSFLVNIKTNVRRRIWLIVIMFLAFFFPMPVYTAMTLSMEKMYMANFRQVDLYLGRVFARAVGPGGGKAIFISLLAVIAAIQGFSYMYQRRKLDMYMSMPVTKGRRFAAIYLNGFLAYFLSYLINMLLSFFVAQAMGANASVAVGEAGCALLANTILYLAVYHIAILAVMLTGNLIVTVMGTAVLLFYDGILYLLFMGYMETFFHSFYYRTAQQYARFIISPVIRFFRFMEIVYGGSDFYGMDRTLHWEKFLPGIWPILLVAVIAFALAYWCYTKKPAEVCGKAMAFVKTKAVIKVLITLEAGLGGGIIFYAFSSSSLLFFVFGMLAGTLLSHGVMEVIYDFDIRSVKNGWKSLLVAGACVAVVFCLFRFDVFGYDDYVPDADAVEDVAMKFTDSYTNFYDENLDSIGEEAYIFDGMHMTNVLPVLELAEASMGNWEAMSENVSPMVVNSARREAMRQEDEIPAYRYVAVRYHLKNGKDVYRQFPVAYRQQVSVLDTILKDTEYQKGAYLVYDEPLMELGDRLEIYYDNGSGSRLQAALSMAQLQQAYAEDLKGFSYTTMLEELVNGRLILECIDNGVYVYANLPVYPSFSKTMALLEQSGLDTDGYLNLGDVEQIVIRNNNSEAYDRYIQEADYTSDTRFGYSNFAVEEAFSDSREMAEIAEALYPDSFREYWMPEEVVDGEYYVTVIYTKKQENAESYSSNFMMLADEIPDFVKEKTTYKGDGSPTNSAPITNAVPVPAYY